MKFAIYSRKSIATNRGDTIKNQIQMCKDYIYRNFPNTTEDDIKIFEDFGASGKNDNREGFINMINLARDKKIDYIVCYKLDRISRNVCDFSKLIEMIDSLSIGFISIKEQFDTSTPIGKAMLYIASVFSQLERETIAERVKDNMNMLAYKGYWLGGNMPTGYSKRLVYSENKKHYVLKENERLYIVKIIYEKMLKYKSITKVANYLKVNKIKSVKGNDISPIGIREILKNPVYCAYDDEIYKYYKQKGSNIVYNKRLINKGYGIMVYNKRSYKKESIKNDENKFIIGIGRHRAVINGYDFLCIQKMIKGREIHKNHNKKALLSGKIFCEKCGAKMIYKAHYNIEKNGIYYYICSNKIYNTKLKCDTKNINGTHIDKYIQEMLKINTSLDIYEKRNAIHKKIQKIFWNGSSIRLIKMCRHKNS